MTEPTKLMPCPFCGGNARKVKHSAGSPGTTGYDRWHGVACAGCNACVGARDRRFRTSAAAIAAWNTRTPQPTRAQAGATPLTDEMVSKAGRALSDLYATECGIDKDDNWKVYGSDFIETAKLVLEAAHGIKGGADAINEAREMGLGEPE